MFPTEWCETSRFHLGDDPLCYVSLVESFFGRPLGGVSSCPDLSVVKKLRLLRSHMQQAPWTEGDPKPSCFVHLFLFNLPPYDGAGYLTKGDASVAA